MIYKWEHLHHLMQVTYGLCYGIALYVKYGQEKDHNAGVC